MTRLLLMFFLTAALSMIRVSNPEDPSKIEKAAVATIHVEGYPDFLEIGFGSLWVSNEGVGAVQRIDAKSNKMIAEVKVNEPCAAMGVGYGALWVASCKDKTILRIDGKTNRVSATIPVAIADSEASIAAGRGERILLGG